MNPADGTVFRGRTTELAQLCRWAKAPTTTSVVVTGDAGIGKSTLVSALAAEASAGECAPVVVGHCAAIASAALPFMAWTEILRTMLDGCAEEQRRKLLGPQRVPLTRFLPELAEEPTGTSATDTNVATLTLFDTLREVLDRAGPMVVVVEDMHWLTRPGLALFDYLLHTHGEHLHLLGTCRGEELGSRRDLSRLVREAARAGLLHHMPLGPLARADVQAIITAAAGAAVSPGVVEQICNQCDGNPLFAAELTRHHLSGASGPPLALVELLTPPKQQLPEDAVAVVHAVAAGGEVTHQLLATVTGLPLARLEQATAAAVAGRVLEVTSDGRGYRFRYELSRQAVYEGVLPGERVRLHAAYAAALVSTTGEGSTDMSTLAAIAQHYRCAGAGGDACRWSLAGANAAESAAAFGAALLLFRQALDLPAPAGGMVGADRLDVLIRASRVAELAGDHEAGLSLAEEALLLVDPDDDPVRAGVLEERKTWCRFFARARPTPTDCLRAVQLIPVDPPSVERAAVLATHARLMALFGRPRQALPVAEEAVSIADGLGADRELSRALTSLGVARSFVGDIAEAMTALEQARDLAEHSAEVDGIASTYDLLAAVKRLWSRDLDGVAAVALTGHESARRLGVIDGHPLLQAAQVSYEAGDWDNALEWALASADLHDHAAVFAHAVHTVVSACRGSVEPSAVEAMEEQWPSTWDEPSVAALSYSEMLAEVQLSEGRPDAAVRTVDVALDHLDADPVGSLSGRLLWFGMRAQADRATAGVDRRDAALIADAHAGAARLREVAAAVHPDPFDPTVNPAPIAAAAGLTWQAEQARLSGTSDSSTWAAAAAAWAALPRPYPQAYCLLRQAEEEMSGPPSRVDVGPALKAALVAAHNLGAAPLERAVHALARRRRVELEPERTTRSETAEQEAGPFVALSAREQQILRLVADGWTNRSIAQRLVVSTKTVDTHVSHLLTKLNAHDRITAAARAARLGLLD